MMQAQPEIQPPSQSGIPVSVINALFAKIQDTTELINEYFLAQHVFNEKLLKRVEKLERSRGGANKKSH